MDFFNQQFTFTVNGLALAGVGIFFIISLICIGVYVYHLITRLRTYEHPKYGFMGKPLYSLMAFVMMVAGLGFFSYSFTQQQNLEIKASRALNGSITDKITLQQGENSTVFFQFIPVVDGVNWGNASDKFDIYWNITGPQNVDNFEFARSVTNPSGFTKSLKKGSYTVKAVVVFDNKSFTFTTPLNL